MAARAVAGAVDRAHRAPQRRDPLTPFQELVGDLDYPMLVVTATAGDEQAGCLVGFATQCSIAPPRFAVWISRKNRTLGVVQDAQVLAVHFLSVDDWSLATLFGGETGDEVDKFARCRWHEGPGGVPVLEDCARWFAGEVVERIPTDDHVGFLLAPLLTHTGPWSGQLGFQAAKALRPGHEP